LPFIFDGSKPQSSENTGQPPEAGQHPRLDKQLQ